MSDWGLRSRILVADHYTVVLTAFVLLAAVGGYATYSAHVADSTETVTRQVASWEDRGDFAHRATVVNGSEAFPEGVTLDDRSVYLRQAAPRLNGTFTYGYDASDGGNVTTNVSVAAVIRSVDRDRGENETVYWTIDRPIGGTSATLSPGERARIPFTVDIDAVVRQAEAIESQVGPTPGRTEIAVLARVDLSGTRNGRQISSTKTYRLPIAVESGIYRVEGSGPITDSGGQRDRVSVPREHGPLTRVGGPLLAFGSFACLTGITTGARRGWLAVSDHDRARLAYRRERDEFDDWIATATVPQSVTDGPVIRMESLTDLVDVAIDSDAPVLEDPDRDRLFVLDDRFHYVYEPARATGNVGGSDEGPDSKGRNGGLDVIHSDEPDGTRNEETPVETDE